MSMSAPAINGIALPAGVTFHSSSPSPPLWASTTSQVSFTSDSLLQLRQPLTRLPVLHCHCESFGLANDGHQLLSSGHGSVYQLPIEQGVLLQGL